MGIGRNQEFSGIAVAEKKIVLYGGTGNVSIYRSDPAIGPCDLCNLDNATNNLPVGVVEVVDPVLLSVRVAEPGCHCCTCCCCDEIPDGVAAAVGGGIRERANGNTLLVSLGIFSVTRIERPAQLLVTAEDYSVPDKECCTQEEDDPCSLFRKMAFPVNEFSATAHSELRENRTTEGGCGCGRGR